MSVWIQETRYSEPGKIPYKVFVERRARMPRLPEWVTDCTVYLYKDQDAATRGEQEGGAGFVVVVAGDQQEPLRPPLWFNRRRGDWGRVFAYVVTNWHVAMKCSVARINRPENGAEAVSLGRWFRHDQADVAVAPVDLPPDSFKLCAIPLDMILSERESRHLEVGLGDEVFIMSRFLNYDGKRTNHPAARHGMVSVMPREDEPVWINQEIGKQVAFLLEARTTPGMSGSPVFLSVPGWELREAEKDSARRSLYEASQAERVFLESADQPVRWQDREIPTPAHIALLGVAGGWIYGPTLKADRGRQEPVKLRTNSGMEWCVPSWKLLELLNYSKLKEQRDAQRKVWDETPPAGAPAS